VRAVVRERRRPWRREAPVEELPARAVAVVEAATGRVDDRLVLQEALARMPARRRAVLVLRYFEGLSVDETAAAMGCSSGTVKSQTARALAALRDLMPDGVTR
jgi:RNA polymerase sigma factor (sigma-70 family)